MNEKNKFISLNEIFKFLDLPIRGDDFITGFNSLQGATNSELSFARHSTKIEEIISSKAKYIFCHTNIKLKGSRYLFVENPEYCFAKSIRKFILTQSKEEISKFAVIGENTKIGKFCQIEAGVVIQDNVVIGDYTNIGANTVIYSNSKIGNHCIIQANCTIGNEGFGFYKWENRFVHFPQTGSCEIGDFVFIGSNSNINKGTLGKTIIHPYVKIDDMVHISHNVEIGENSIIAGQTGIAGSTIIGKNCLISGRVSIFDHIKIGNNVKIAGGSVVLKDIPDDSFFSGFPARPHFENYRTIAGLNLISKKFRQLMSIIRENE